VLGSIVIPAHNEASVIGRCLDALFDGLDADEVEVVVVCNGCSDQTAVRARSSGHEVDVLELDEPSKSKALRAGDAAVSVLPRIYLDADVVLTGSSVRRLLGRLAGGAVAARPPIAYDIQDTSWPVRRYFRARQRIPAVNQSLWGAGVYGLSMSGRGRFGEFPRDLVADDLWVDRHFARAEVEIVACDPVLVHVPRRSRDLVRTLRRTYHGKSEEIPAARPANSSTETLPGTVSDLVRLAAVGPSAALDALVYAAFACSGRVALRTQPASRQKWERDESTRTGGPLNGSLCGGDSR
jgi:glycosyltransferase involved in cell wall biosynthesis